MSKAQLQTNNSKLFALISELQGKATSGSGGGSVETCTVTIVNNLPVIDNIHITVTSEEGLEKQTVSCDWNSSITIENIVCNTMILFYYSNVGMISITGDATQVWSDISANTYDNLAAISCNSGQITITLANLSEV